MSDAPWSSSALHAIDVFVDLSTARLARPALQNVIERWARQEQLGAIARKVTGVVPVTLPDVTWPPDWNFAASDPPLRALSRAIVAAGSDGVPLLLLVGPVDVSCEALGVMFQSLERDSMFGFAVPRMGCRDRCCFARLSRHGVGETGWLPRKILADLPDTELLVEIAAPCVLIGPQVLRNFEALSRRFQSLAAAMLHYMAGARRCGFRTVLCNRAVVGIDGLTCDDAVKLLSDPLPSDLASLRQLVPDLERNWQEFRSGSWERFERLCTSTIDGPKAASRPSLLLDVRNAGPFYNGTVQAVLGIASALKALEPKWDVALFATVQGTAFHDLKRGYEPWPVYTTLPDDRSFTVTLRPSQPWHISEMVDVHRVSLVNAYLLLDTINWDIAYAAPPHLEGTWQFLASHADALLFDSEFTRQRFVERFPNGASVPGLVTHFSFDPNEYVQAGVQHPAVGEEFILVIGNNLDHKDVRPTVDALASAFPFRRIKALGPAKVLSRFVTALPSGTLLESDVQRLYASAQYVVCPSFYEGFGFPIVTALAYGRTVLARRSALLEEVAAQCDPRRGRLIVFERREELVELLGRLVHGEPVPEYPLGAGLRNDRPRTWRDVAQSTLEFLEAVARRPPRSRWIARERVVRQLMSYRA